MIDLYGSLAEIARQLKGKGLTFALCGGLAVGVYGASRHTIDIDIVIVPEDLKKAQQALVDIGYMINQYGMPVAGGKMMIYRMLKFLPDEPQPLMVDLCMPDPKHFPEVWREWETSEVGGVEMFIVSRKGLIEMKRDRSSDKDLSDIKELERG